MNATEPLTEEDALWASIDAMPSDQLRRLVIADWYEERGQEDMAAALRATADMAPYPTHGVHNDEYWWYGSDGENKVNMVQLVVWHELTGKVNESWSSRRMKDYTTAADAIRDLCRAWVKVHREGTA